MNEPQATSSRYWVLLGTPQGPWTTAEILERLKAGDIVPTTTVCQVGQQYWVPLHSVPEFSEVVPPPVPSLIQLVPSDAPVPSAVTETQSTTSPPLAPPTRPKRQNAILLGVGTVFGIAVMTWMIAKIVEWVAPGPERVANKFLEAENLAEAKKWSTPRMYPVLDAFFSDKTPGNPNDEVEITSTTDGPSGSKLVGFRGKFFVPEAGQRVAMEGHLRLVKTDGWKVDDMVVNGIEGVAMEGPMSYVDMHAAEQAAKRAEASARQPSGSPKKYEFGKSPILKGPSIPPKSLTTVEWLEKYWKGIAAGIVVILMSVYGTDSRKKSSHPSNPKS